LNEVIQKETAKHLAIKSEAERQQFEEIKTQYISRMRRVYIIGGIISALLMAGLMILRIWLQQKH
jgi:hypothetical protein